MNTKEELENQKGIEETEDNYIESIIYYTMWDSDAYWKIIGESTEGLKKLKYQKDKYDVLKDNI